MFEAELCLQAALSRSRSCSSPAQLQLLLPHLLTFLPPFL